MADDVTELERRVDALEQWRAAREALSGSRRWVIPVMLTAVVTVATVVNVIINIRG